MSERVYDNVIDKSTWGSGPWQSEPDKVQWTDPETALPCLAIRGPAGSWCGYVGVSNNHPAFEKDYDDVDVHVHGGLTYADHCQTGQPESHAICHVPEPGQPDNVWWLGFDCAHAFDLMPAFTAMLPTIGKLPQAEYRTLDYVRGEVASLARQLAVLKVSSGS